MTVLEIAVQPGCILHDEYLVPRDVSAGALARQN